MKSELRSINSFLFFSFLSTNFPRFFPNSLYWMLKKRKSFLGTTKSYLNADFVFSVVCLSTTSWFRRDLEGMVVANKAITPELKSPSNHFHLNLKNNKKKKIYLSFGSFLSAKSLRVQKIAIKSFLNYLL